LTTSEKSLAELGEAPTSVLRCILRHGGEAVSMPHSSGFARLAFEAFYRIIAILAQYVVLSSFKNTL